MSTRCFMAQDHEEKQRPGALWWAEGRGGRMLLGRLPDHAVANLSLWTVTGEAPDVTVVPSVKGEHGWHGQIVNGWMVPAP